MNYSTFLIVGLLLIIIILLLVILTKRSNDNNKTNEKDDDVEPVEGTMLPAGDTALQLSSVDSIILQNVLGQELTFSRPSEIGAAKYMEVNINGAGNVAQYAGQSAVNIYTLNEISNIAGMELYTSEVPREELLKNFTYKDGKIASVQFRSADGTGIQSHHGFEVFDASSVAGIEPMILTAVAMQGMAVVSGQYYLKQINKSLNKISKDIEELKELHESNTRGTLRYCRKRLMEISQIQHCSETDIMEIRDIAGKAGEIREQYQDRYESAVREVESYKFETLFVDSAIKEYNGKVAKMRYLLQICMVADRIVDEARLAEFVTRRKMNVNDPKLEDTFNLMEENYRFGFNARMNEEAINLAQRIRDKGRRIINNTFDPKANLKLLESVNKNADGIESDIIDITGCVRRVEENQNKLEHVGLLLSEKGDEPRFFVELSNEEDPENRENV